MNTDRNQNSETRKRSDDLAASDTHRSRSEPPLHRSRDQITVILENT